MDEEQNSKRHIGRRTKLTPEIRDKICELVRAGNYGEVAARCAGIHPATFYRWQERGREGRAPYGEFCDCLEKATAEAEARNIVTIQKASQEQWQAAAWFLERKHHERWGRRDRLGLEGGDTDKPILISDAKSILISRLTSPATSGSETEGHSKPD